MADLTKYTPKQLKAIKNKSQGLSDYFQFKSMHPDAKSKAVHSDFITRAISGEIKRRSAKNNFKVTFPTDSVVTYPIYGGGITDPEAEGKKQDALLLQENGVLKKSGKKNTTFTGTKKALKGYFGAYGTDLLPEDFKKVK